MKPPCEFRVLRLRECQPEPSLIDTPDRAAEYWKANIPAAPWFDPCKEAFVVLVLNTRRRILGATLFRGELDDLLRREFMPMKTLCKRGYMSERLVDDRTQNLTP